MTNNNDEIINDFGLYLTNIQQVGKGARTNYLSWIRFLSNDYVLDKISTEDEIRYILEQEEIKRQLPSRTKYKKRKDIGNFRATLNRFLPFMNIRKVELDYKNDCVSISQLIDNIRLQATPEFAKCLYDAINMVAITSKHIFSEEEQVRMRENMMYVTSGKVNNNFLSGSNPTLYQS